MAKVERLHSVASRLLTYAHKIPISKTQIFWEKLKEGKIFATKCKNCGKVYYPPQTDCSECLKSEFEWVELGDSAVLQTYTLVEAKPQGFSHYEPYIIAIATTPENVKIMGWLEKIGPENIRIGMNLKINTKIVEDGYVTIIFTERI